LAGLGHARQPVADQQARELALTDKGEALHRSLREYIAG
jgi:hypothetical protein